MATMTATKSIRELRAAYLSFERAKTRQLRALDTIGRAESRGLPAVQLIDLEQRVLDPAMDELIPAEGRLLALIGE